MERFYLVLKVIQTECLLAKQLRKNLPNGVESAKADESKRPGIRGCK